MAEDERADLYGELWADVYDEEHASMAPPESQLRLLAELAGDGRVLELGIGTGRVALPLSARGVVLEGVDASPSMVARLRSKPGGQTIPVAIGDMAKLELDGPFRLVFVVFNTIFALLTQEAQVACFRRVGALLQPGGCFLLECFVPDVGRFDRGQSFRSISVDDDVVRVDASRHDAAMQQVRSALIRLGGGEPSMRPVKLRYAWPAELDLMAQLAGLYLRDRWSSWERAPFRAVGRTIRAMREELG
jgi:SAM-dependent methyltransferase